MNFSEIALQEYLDHYKTASVDEQLDQLAQYFDDNFQQYDYEFFETDFFLAPEYYYDGDLDSDSELTPRTMFVRFRDCPDVSSVRIIFYRTSMDEINSIVHHVYSIAENAVDSIVVSDVHACSTHVILDRSHNSH